jgi:hypothetical protein
MATEAVNIVTYIANSFIILITFYLIFLYIKGKEFHQKKVFNIILLGMTLFFDNILRLIPMDVYILRHIQAFLLTFFDKLILTTITSQALIIYFGACQTRLYYKNELAMFLVPLILGLAISAALTILYIIIANKEVGNGGITNFDGKNNYFYVIGTDLKVLCDTIFNGVFLFVNVFCSVVLLIFLSQKKKKAELGIIEDLDYGHHHLKIILMFILNSMMFIESFLIIYDKMPSDYIDLIYVISCLLLDLYYAINKIIIKETMRIFCFKLYNKKYPDIKDADTVGVENDEGEYDDN